MLNLNVMTLESCLCVMFRSWFCVLESPVFDFHVFVSCLVVSYVLIFHALLCHLSISYVHPLSPLIIVLFPPCFLLCAPLSHYHTWPPPSSLPSPVPCLIISVCVLSLCFPSCLWSVHCLCLRLLLLMILRISSPLMVCFGFEFSMFDLYFAFFFALCLTVCLFFLLHCPLSPCDCFLFLAPLIFAFSSK